MLRVTVMSGPQDGHELRTNRTAITVGRGDETDLHLPHDPALSPDGACIRLIDGQVRIQHHGQTCTAAPGELFRLGQTWLQVETT
jgi:hypothetical protein